MLHTVYPQLDIRIVQLNQADEAFLSAIMDGQTLGEAAATGTQANEAFDLNNALSMLMGTGATQSITLDAQEI